MSQQQSNMDEYLSKLNAVQRQTLQQLRATIHQLLPACTEGISYGLPAFLWNGKAVAAISASKSHCSYFPMSGRVVHAMTADLAGYDCSKGTIRFPSGKALPVKLVKKAIQLRLAEIQPKETGATKTSRKRVVQPGTRSVVNTLKKLSNTKTLQDMAPRYGIHTNKAFGVPMAKMLQLAKQIGKDHALALALWKTEWYEARMVACMIDDPVLVTRTQMNQWCKEFDNWGICDTVCFKLFDQVPFALEQACQWQAASDEFVKRAGFALIACVALHRKELKDEHFFKLLPLLENGADDPRNFVKKSVSWALRSIATRSPELRLETLAVAQRLAASSNTASRWVSKDVLRQVTKRK